MIAASAEVGAIIGGANEYEIAAVRDYASRLGLLFQITDDLLDVTQSTEALGKTAGKDAASKKATYPGSFGIDRTRELAGEVTDEARRAISAMDRDTSLLESLAGHVLNRTA